MKLIMKDYIKYNKDEILGLYNSVGWTNYTNNPDMLEKAFKNSLKILGAYDNERLIGIIRVVGDGCSIIYIQDLLVSPEFQHMGVGSALIKQILNRYQEVYQKVLLTENTEKTINFYKSAGFDQDSDVNCCAFLKMY